MSTKLKSNNVNDTANVLPSYINLDKWQDVGYQWSGSIIPSQLPRLKSNIAKGYLDVPINLNCQLVKEGQLLKLNMHFDGSAWVICQRCLQPVSIDISHKAQLILLQSEAEKSLVDESDDYIEIKEVIENDLAKKQDTLLPVKMLIEEELLLEVPLSAKHDDCEMVIDQVGEIPEEQVDNPFAALETLKGKL